MIGFILFLLVLLLILFLHYLPTIVVIAWLLCISLIRSLKIRIILYTISIAIYMGYFVHSRHLAEQEFAAIQAHIESIPVEAAPLVLPDTLIIESNFPLNFQEIADLKTFRFLIWNKKGWMPKEIEKYDLAADLERVKPEKITSLPETALYLKTNQDAYYAKDRRIMRPFELYYKTGNRLKLISFYGKPSVSIPYMPILTASGWRIKSIAYTMSDDRRNIQLFVADSVGKWRSRHWIPATVNGK